MFGSFEKVDTVDSRILISVAATQDDGNPEHLHPKP